MIIWSSEKSQRSGEILKVGSFQGTILLQSSFPRTRESRFVLAELAWIPAFMGMTDLNRYPVGCYHSAPAFFEGGRNVKTTKVS
jgi:hypothetical protein